MPLLPHLTADQLTGTFEPVFVQLLDQLEEDAAWDVDTDAVGELRWELGGAYKRRLKVVQDADQKRLKVVQDAARVADLEAAIARFSAHVFAPDAHRQPWWCTLVFEARYLKDDCGALPVEQDRTRLLQALQPARLRVEEQEQRAKQDAAAVELEAWRTRAVTCSWIPDLCFLDAVPCDYKAAWRQIDDLPAAQVLRGLRDWSVWKSFPLDAFRVVRDYMNQAIRRPADHRRWDWPADAETGAFDAQGRPFPHKFGFLAVLRAVAWQRGIGTAEAAWKWDQRRRAKVKVAAICGGVCRACGAPEADAVEPLELNHLLYGQGGQKRKVVLPVRANT